MEWSNVRLDKYSNFKVLESITNYSFVWAAKNGGKVRKRKGLENESDPENDPGLYVVGNNPQRKLIIYKFQATMAESGCSMIYDSSQDCGKVNKFKRAKIVTIESSDED